MCVQDLGLRTSDSLFPLGKSQQVILKKLEYISAKQKVIEMQKNQQQCQEESVEIGRAFVKNNFSRKMKLAIVFNRIIKTLSRK